MRIETHSDIVIGVIFFMHFDFDDIPCLLGVVVCIIPELHAKHSLEFPHRSHSKID